MKLIKMESQNKYLGDDKFQKFLQHYSCPTPLGVIKMKFAGALCSPNMELRPTDVISSFWEQGLSPRLETKDEAELFFKFFMGLWDELYSEVKQNKVKLFPKFHKMTNEAEMLDFCRLRYEETEHGFVEGFWGGRSDLKLPAYLAEIIDSVSEMAEVYLSLAKKLESGADLGLVAKHLQAADEMVEKAVSFIIENSVLPRIETLQRTVN